MASTTRIRRAWTVEENQVLIREAEAQIQQGSLRDWNRIAAKLPGRTNKDCRKRWSKVCKDLKKGGWDPEEDERLRQAVREYGCRWTQVAKVTGTRHADQCAKRWQHSLDPAVDRSKWRPDEDERLLKAVKTYGQSWKVIAEKVFPRRSTTDIKNRYSTIMRKRVTASTSKNPQEAQLEESHYSESDHSDSEDNDNDDDDDDDEEEGGELEQGGGYPIAHAAYPTPSTSTARTPAERSHNYPSMLGDHDMGSAMNQDHQGMNATLGGHHMNHPYPSFDGPYGDSCDPCFYDGDGMLTLGTDWSAANFGSRTGEASTSNDIHGNSGDGRGEPEPGSDADLMRGLDAFGDTLTNLDEFAHQQQQQQHQQQPQQQQSNIDASSSKTVLTIENVSSPALNDVLSVLMKNKTKFKLEAN